MNHLSEHLSGHLSEEDLILIHYGERGLPKGAQAHLGECEQCRAAADALARTLNLCNEFRVPEPPAGFERGVWARLAPELAPQEESRPGGWMIPRLWIAVAAAAMLLIGAFLVGRESRSSQPSSLPSSLPSIAAGLSNRARERILEISLADHLDRADMLLTEISNAGDSGSLNFAPERSRAQDLVEEGRLMRQTLASQGGSATLTFLDEVERFMLEIANAPDAVGPQEVRELQQRIGSDSLLFKVRIIESNLRTQGQKS
jgi:hypothetical protein